MAASVAVFDYAEGPFVGASSSNFSEWQKLADSVEKLGNSLSPKDQHETDLL